MSEQKPSDDTLDYLVYVNGDSVNVPHFCDVLTWHRGGWMYHGKHAFCPVMYWMDLPESPAPTPHASKNEGGGR